MNSNIRIAFLILILCCCFYSESEAKNCEGYIITNESDTIKGIINLSTFSKRTGNLIIKDFDLEITFIQIPFKKLGEKKFTVYSPKQIKEYGFIHKETPYKYKSFVIKSNTFISSEKENYDFLLLVRTNNDTEYYQRQKYKLSTSTKELIPYYEFYSYNAKEGLKKVK